MTSEKVSVVIPAYNVELYIERCIRSVINDPYVEEIIVVDDGSSDKTTTIIKGNFINNPKLILLYHENNSNRGACASRNLGLYHAKANWVQFLDADDVLLPGKFERQLQITNEKDLDLILGSYYFIDGVKKYVENPLKKDLWLGFVNNKLGHTNSNLWKKSSIINIGGWANHWPSNQEYELLFRALKNNFKIGYDFVPSSEYIKRQNSISTSGNNQGWQRQIFLRLELGDYLFEIGELNEKLSLAIHEFVFNKLILIKREKSLKDDWEILNDRYLLSPWYKNIYKFKVSKRILVYSLLGFKLTEILIKGIRFLKKKAIK